MRSLRLTFAAAATVVVLLACAPPGVAAAARKAPPKAPSNTEAEPLPTMEEIRRFYEQGENQKVLRAVFRLGALRGDAARDAAERYDPCELMRLKAETYLR